MVDGNFEPVRSSSSKPATLLVLPFFGPRFVEEAGNLGAGETRLAPLPQMNATSVELPVTNSVISVLVMCTSAVVLFGISCSVELHHLRAVAHSRKGMFVIGLLSQWVVMPALTCGFAQAFKLDEHLGFALICIGCAPGGTSSNTLTYLSGGDNALSVSLTCCTNFLALGTLPLFLFVWTSWADLEVKIPFEQIALSLTIVLLPALSGIVMRAKNPKIARVCERTGAVLGIFTTGVALLVAIAANWEALTTKPLIPPNCLYAVLLAAPGGMVYAFSTLGGITLARRACWGAESGGARDGERDASGTAREAGEGASTMLQQAITVVLETGIQNIPLALSVINVTLSTGEHTADEIFAAQLLSAIWSVITTIEGIILMVFARKLQRLSLCPRCTASKEESASALPDVSVEKEAHVAQEA